MSAQLREINGSCRAVPCCKDIQVYAINCTLIGRMQRLFSSLASNHVNFRLIDHPCTALSI
jgi:hypothetical protein